jgi:enamine deaminase RidA (YjgF/YER057c/UK114 family)
MQRQLISSGSPWEPKVGFSRAVRVGNQVFISGTLATDPDGKPMAPDAYGQAKAIFAKFESALHQAGGGLKDIVRTRMYIVNKGDADEVSRVHAEVLGHVRPAATMIQVAGFVGEGFLVEIEADAVIA